MSQAKQLRRILECRAAASQVKFDSLAVRLALHDEAKSYFVDTDFVVLCPGSPPWKPPKEEIDELVNVLENNIFRGCWPEGK
jgi:hypothetical protein